VSILLHFAGRKDLRCIGDLQLGCLRRLESSSMVMTSGKPMTLGSGASASGLLRSDLAMRKGSEGAYMCGHSFRSKGSSGLSSVGEPRFYNLRDLRPTSPTTNGIMAKASCKRTPHGEGAV
jgi:hypothetical protein